MHGNKKIKLNISFKLKLQKICLLFRFQHGYILYKTRGRLQLYILTNIIIKQINAKKKERRLKSVIYSVPKNCDLAPYSVFLLQYIEFAETNNGHREGR